jgi:acyl-CoA thioesterase FadM
VLLLFRFLFINFKARFRSRIGWLDESRVRFTVLPHDCDLNIHLNGGRFVSFMDIARIELLSRMRIFMKVLRLGWRPVMGGIVVRFRRSVLPFQRFDIRSRLVGWDEKWFYIEHIVEKDGQFCASGHARVVIRDKSRTITPRDVLTTLGLDVAQPPLPEFVARWTELESAR